MLSYEQAVARREADERGLGLAFLQRMHAGPRHTALIDPTGSMSRVRLAAAALALRDLLEAEVAARVIGVLLPPGKGGAVVNLALALAGRTAVNLNHTAGETQVERMCEIAGITTIISARKYLDRIDSPRLPGRVLLADEDLLPRVSKTKTAAMMARLQLTSFEKLRRLDHAHSHDVAAIVFSSGSTGDPKGIQLTHAQILANIEAASLGLNLHEAHTMLSALPLFHSFGLVPGMWLGLTAGVTVAAFPNPRDLQGYGRHAERAQATALISTPTFCRQYLKKISPQNFATLQYAVVGAEKCPSDLRAAFEEKYGAVLLEGYGCTELSPIVSTNATSRRDGPDARTPTYRETVLEGSVGLPLPGIEVLIVDPQTLAERPRGEEGLIIVRSPARMLGYLKRDDLTDEAFALGGYITGDVGRLDEDGFLFITGRLARFAKLGGEMVPLDTLEDRLQVWLNREYPESECEVAVSSVPDQAKGERLILLHTELPCPVGDLIEAALADFPALFRPRPRDAYSVEEIPALGTGKRDLKGVQAMALRIASGKDSAAVK